MAWLVLKRHFVAGFEVQGDIPPLLIKSLDHWILDYIML